MGSTIAAFIAAAAAVASAVVALVAVRSTQTAALYQLAVTYWHSRDARDQAIGAAMLRDIRDDDTVSHRWRRRAGTLLQIRLDGTVQNAAALSRGAGGPELIYPVESGLLSTALPGTGEDTAPPPPPPALPAAGPATASPATAVTVTATAVPESSPTSGGRCSRAARVVIPAADRRDARAQGRATPTIRFGTRAGRGGGQPRDGRAGARAGRRTATPGQGRATGATPGRQRPARIARRPRGRPLPRRHRRPRRLRRPPAPDPDPDPS